jgi:predicted RNase H-like HicB family nuclease
MENEYEIILYWSKDDNAVIAEVPELAGCTADGSDYHEALLNIEIVVAQWIQTAKDLRRNIPFPKRELM